MKLKNKKKLAYTKICATNPACTCYMHHKCDSRHCRYELAPKTKAVKEKDCWNCIHINGLKECVGHKLKTLKRKAVKECNGAYDCKCKCRECDYYDEHFHTPPTNKSDWEEDWFPILCEALRRNDMGYFTEWLKQLIPPQKANKSCKKHGFENCGNCGVDIIEAVKPLLANKRECECLFNHCKCCGRCCTGLYNQKGLCNSCLSDTKVKEDERLSCPFCVGGSWGFAPDYWEVLKIKHEKHQKPSPPTQTNDREEFTIGWIRRGKVEAQALSSYKAELREKLQDKNFELMEPCEPDCDKVRHAKHQGSWEHYIKMEKAIDDLLDK